MGNQWGTFTFASPQPKRWGDVSPPVRPIIAAPESYSRYANWFGRFGKSDAVTQFSGVRMPHF